MRRALFTIIVWGLLQYVALGQVEFTVPVTKTAMAPSAGDASTAFVVAQAEGTQGEKPPES